MGELELLEEHLTITIGRQYANTSLRQVYSNHSEDRLEGRYTLQAGAGAKVHGFSYWNGEDRIVGEVLGPVVDGRSAHVDTRHRDPPRADPPLERAKLAAIDVLGVV